MKNLYFEKLNAVEELSTLGKKRITDSDISSIATKHNLKTKTLKKSWMTFQETGGKQIDRRITTLAGSLKFKSKFTTPTRGRKITPEEAGDILIEYMTNSKINSRELCAKHKISTVQFYDWIKELNVSGTLLGHTVLNPKKYAKLEIKDVIWFKKRPDTKRESIVKLTFGEKCIYKRVADVLLNYLPQTKKETTK